MITDNIQKNQSFIEYRFKPLSFPVLAAFLPSVYLIPTVYVMFNIARVYIGTVLRHKDDTINPHVFFIITLQQFSSFCYMLSDYANIRLPATGILTAWCASVDPNHFIKAVFCLSIYFNYLTMLFPFLLALVRLFPIYYPSTYFKLSRTVIRSVTPLVFLYPLCFMFFMWPALGVCRQYPEPYEFGAVYVHFDGSWNNMKNYPFLLANATFWFIATVIANLLLYSKLRILKIGRSSPRLRKAELSLSVTTAVILISYLTNMTFLTLFGVIPPLAAYTVVLRPFGSDCETVVVPWIFFLVHPVFRKKSDNLKMFLFPGRTRGVVSIT